MSFGWFLILTLDLYFKNDTGGPSWYDEDDRVVLHDFRDGVVLIQAFFPLKSNAVALLIPLN